MWGYYLLSRRVSVRVLFKVNGSSEMHEGFVDKTHSGNLCQTFSSHAQISGIVEL